MASFYDFRDMPQSLKWTQTGYWNYRVSRLANHEYSQELNTSEILNLSQKYRYFLKYFLKKISIVAPLDLANPGYSVTQINELD
ncbi:MAG: hypothetical protein IPH28_05530 [Cytophagaceae bacterium]|nr:hypothetical protein [Cytophagaceae bacterium]